MNVWLWLIWLASLISVAGLVSWLCGRSQTGRVIFSLGPIVEQPTDGPSRRGTPRKAVQGGAQLSGDLTMAFAMSDSQQVLVTPTFLDKKNNPVTPTDTPSWFTDNSDLLLLEPAADGLSCLVKAGGPLGSGNVSCRANTPSGPVVGLGQVTITAGAATQIALNFGPAEEQPDAPPPGP